MATAVPLAVALARRLASLLPDEVSILVQREGGLAFSDETGQVRATTDLRGVESGLWAGQGPRRQDLELAVEGILFDIQDTVVTEFRRIWPYQDDSERLLDPWARVEGAMLLLGYGPKLELEPIPLAELNL